MSLVGPLLKVLPRAYLWLHPIDLFFLGWGSLKMIGKWKLALSAALIAGAGAAAIAASPPGG